MLTNTVNQLCRAIDWTGQHKLATFVIVFLAGGLLAACTLPYQKVIEEQRYDVVREAALSSDSLSESQKSFLIDATEDGRVTEEEFDQVLDVMIRQPLREGGLRERQVESMVSEAKQSDRDLVERVKVYAVIAGTAMSLLMTVIVMLGLSALRAITARTDETTV